MPETTYKQPFVYMTSLKSYPMVHELIDANFPKISYDDHKNMYMIICSLLHYPSVAVSRNSSFYRMNKFPTNGNTWYTRNSAVRSQDLLEGKGLIRIRRGRRARPGYRTGFASVITPTESLVNMLKGVVLKPLRTDPSMHPTMKLDKKAASGEYLDKLEKELFNGSPLSPGFLIKDFVRVNRLNNNYFADMTLGFEEGTIMSLDGLPFEEARKISLDLYEYTDDGIPVVIATNPVFTAMYTRKGCGRLYQTGNSFQNIGKNFRRFLTINQEKTRQVDYSGMHVNILYFLAGMENPDFDDPYRPIMEKMNIPTFLRDAIKKCVLVAINTKDYATFSKAMWWNHRREVRDLARSGVSLRDIYEAFPKAYGDVGRIMLSGASDPAIVMFHESQILRNVIEALEAEGINALPLHDAVICDANHTRKVKGVMEDKYKERTGNRIGVKVK